MPQQAVWQLTVLLIAALGAVFLFVILKSRERAEYGPIKDRAYRLRGRLFWALVLIGTPVVGYTLRDLPYTAAQRQTQPLNIGVVAHQWYWKLDREQAPAGTPVVFNVTSADVNHGFAVYDADMRLVAQTQAMPGYTNRLVHTFDRPGTYRIMCLEYCGIAHHQMTAEFKVVAGNDQPKNR